MGPARQHLALTCLCVAVECHWQVEDEVYEISEEDFDRLLKAGEFAGRVPSAPCVGLQAALGLVFDSSDHSIWA